MNIRLFPPEEMIDATIKLPLSKSICNRLLIINALTPGAPMMDNIAYCDDSRVLMVAIEALRKGAKEINVMAAGTVMRFLAAFLACDNGVTALGSTITIDGTERMRHRPIAPLVDALRALGAEIEYAGEEGYPPLRITSRKLVGGNVEVDSSISSQFISALMMVAPTCMVAVSIKLLGETASKPYILMTESLMKRAGASVEVGRDSIEITPGQYQLCDYTIEPDWSAASYWYAISAISAGFITLAGLELPSIQGDSRCAELFEMLGVNTAPAEPDEDEDDDAPAVEGLALCPSPEQFSRFEVDLHENPDLAQTFAVTAALLGIPFHLRGLSSLRIKETDRLEAIRAELDKIGIVVEIRGGSELVWNGERHPIVEMPRFEVYDDHRMAMALAPVSIFIPGIVINDSEVVSKSYPDFWKDLESAGFTIVDADAPMVDAAGDELSDEVKLSNSQMLGQSGPDSKVL